MDDDKLYFVHIEQPKQIKKDLLESSKVTIDSLRSFEEKYKKFKTQKIQKMEMLKQTVSEINEANERLKVLLPVVKSKRVKSVVEKKTDEKILPKFTESQLDRLEDDLASIESDLRSLS